MNTQKRYPREVRERAVRMVLEHEGEYDSQGATIGPVAYDSDYFVKVTFMPYPRLRCCGSSERH